MFKETPKVNYEKSGLKSVDLSFKVAASLNRCRDFKQGQQTSPQTACQQLQRSEMLQQADEDQQETPTIAKQRSYRELRRKISEVSNQLIDQEPQTYPAISRRHSGKELQQKTQQILNLHFDREQPKHSAISRQNASHKLQQKATQVSNQFIDQVLSEISRQHSGKDVQRKTLKASNQHATQEEQNKISDKMSRQNGCQELHQKSPNCSYKNADKEQQKHARMISQYGGQQQKMPTVSKKLTEQQQNQMISNHNSDQEQETNCRISKHADHALQQMTSKIFKQHNNQELQEQISSKQNGDKELQQNPRTLEHTSQDLQQKNLKIAKQHTVQNARMSKQSADQTVQQKTSKKPKKLVDQELQVNLETAQSSDDDDVYVSNSRNYLLQEEDIDGNQLEDDYKSTVSSLSNIPKGNITKVESSSEGSQCTEKQVNTFEVFLVTDDKENTEYENWQRSK